MNGKLEIQDVIDLTQKVLGKDATGHDFFHAQRVARLAVKMYIKDFPDYSNEDVKLLLLMGYLHDVIDDKITENSDWQLKLIQQLPSVERLSTEARDELFYTIQHMSYSKNLERHYELSQRGKYVQDADRIDALGAIGIARAFAYGGKKGNLIYDPNIPVSEDKSKQTYRTKETTTINHFYEKLLKLHSLMNTTQGKIIAAERTAYMEQFLKQFFSEWEED